MADAARQMNCADSNDEPALVVIAKDTSGVARGAWFPTNDKDTARTSAEAQGDMAIAVKGAEMLALANRVPKGRIFDSGKLFMPRIQGEVFDKLVGLMPAEKSPTKLELVASGNDKGPKEAAGKDEGEGKHVEAGPDSVKGTLPSDWSKIGVGSLVLTRDIEEDDEAFYLAVVMGKPSPTTLTLKWRDYPDIALITRNVQQIAMLHPKVDMTELEWDWEE